MPEFPTGVITLVFTDIEGSSSLWEAHREAFAPVLAEHNRLMREAAARWNGVEVKTEGDAFFLVFARASDAVNFSVDVQRALNAHRWNEVHPEVETIRVRIGMHAGEPIFGEHPGGLGDYFGPVVNRAARVGAAGYGGQIVLSGGTRELALAGVSEEIGFLDLGRHRLKGVGEESLWQVTHPELPERFPPLKTMAGARHNLPVPHTTFVGRDEEISGWSELLRSPEVRLLSLLGFGGQGKTRLGLQLAETVVEHFADGVWWVELEEARDSGAMIDRIAHELRIHLQPQPTVREQVFNFHRDRELLLVLDNTEQIPDAGKVVSDLLAAGPRVKCLVTTRRALDVRAERIVHVPPLPLPDAVQLFASRAAHRHDQFRLTPENQSSVEDLCRSLEGVPLAIELAASRIGVLSPDEMLGRLGERFRLLQTRAPDLPPRQRALRGAIDWSYELLSEEDRQLLAQVAVFHGGFDLAAAEAVCDAFDVLEGVDELRRHSLLRGEESGGKTRFSMLESVRAYAEEKQQELGVDAGLRERHAKHYTAVVERLAARLRGRTEAGALDEFWRERANARTALEWAAENGRADLGTRLAVAQFDLLYRLGLWNDAASVIELGLRLSARETNPNLRPALRLRSGMLAQDTGDLKRAAEEAQLADELARGLGDRRCRADAQNLLGLVAADQGELEEAGRYFQSSLDLREADEHHGQAIALHNLARLASRRGEREEARRLYEAALEKRRAGADARGEAETLGNLGALVHIEGDLATARGLYLQSLELRRVLRDRMGIALMLYNLGEVAEQEADFPRAIILFVHAGRIFRELGSAYASAPVEALSRVQAQLGEAYRPLLAEAGQTSWEEMVGEVVAPLQQP